METLSEGSLKSLGVSQEELNVLTAAGIPFENIKRKGVPDAATGRRVTGRALGIVERVRRRNANLVKNVRNAATRKNVAPVRRLPYKGEFLDLEAMERAIRIVEGNVAAAAPTRNAEKDRKLSEFVRMVRENRVLQDTVTKLVSVEKALKACEARVSAYRNSDPKRVFAASNIAKNAANLQSAAAESAMKRAEAEVAEAKRMKEEAEALKISLTKELEAARAKCPGTTAFPPRGYGSSPAPKKSFFSGWFSSSTKPVAPSSSWIGQGHTSRGGSRKSAKRTTRRRRLFRRTH
jgi:hypothetical protein